MRTETETKGIIHVHTSFSQDGTMDPAALRKFCLWEGLSFACVTDHAEDVSRGGMQSLVKACDAATDSIFAAVPGLEFRVDGHVHVLALGLRYMPPERGPSDLLKELRDSGAVTVLAHPIATGAQVNKQLLEMLDGIEVWNASHDGGFFPNPAALRLYAQAADYAPHILAFGGSDLHTPDQPVRVRTVMHEPAPLPDIVENLALGRFGSAGRFWHVGSRPRISAPDAAALITSYRAYASGKRVRDVLRHCAAMGRQE